MQKIINKDKTTVTVEELKEKFPTKAKTVTQELVDLINDANNDPSFNGDELLNSLYSYENIMYKNSASLKEYVNAVKFVANLMGNDDNYTAAYMKARSGDEFVRNAIGKSTESDEYKAVVAAASRYRKNRLVVDLLTQVSIPWDIMYSHASHKAFGVLTDEMMNAPLSRDRINAAKAVLENVKPNEMKIELDAGERTVNMAEMLNTQLLEISERQKRLLDLGQDVKDVQKIGINLDKVVDAEIVDA